MLLLMKMTFGRNIAVEPFKATTIETLLMLAKLRVKYIMSRPKIFGSFQQKSKAIAQTSNGV